MTSAQTMLADNLEQAARHKSYWSIDDAVLVNKAAAFIRAASAPAAVRDREALKRSFIEHVRLIPCDRDAFSRHADDSDDDLAWRVKPESLEAFLDAATPEEASIAAGKAVAWRWKTVPGGDQWFVRDYRPDPELIAVHSVEPLYAAPPAAQTDGVKK